ncbi:MAG: glycosyltransferase family A protein [Bryobacteraceae bacterium]
MNEPLVSVIVPAHNAAAHIGMTLRNILSQSYSNLEVWVVDDGSEDETARVVQSFDGPIRYRHQNSQGPAAARNSALKIAQGEIVAFLDADDLWSKHHLARSVRLFQEDPSLGIVQSWTRNWRSGRERGPSYCTDPYRFTMLCSSVYRHSVFDKVGLLDSSLRFGEDSDFFIRCYEHHIAKRIYPDVSLYYHRHGGNMTAQKSLQQLGVVQVYKRRRDRIRDGLLDAAAVRGEGLREYCGEPPLSYDDGRFQPVGEEILSFLK